MLTRSYRGLPDPSPFRPRSGTKPRPQTVPPQHPTLHDSGIPLTNQAVKSERLSENQNQNHTDEQLGLLGVSAASQEKDWLIL